MAITDFFESPALSLPLKHESDDFIAFLKGCFDNFYQELEARKNDHSVLSAACRDLGVALKLGNGILETLGHYCSGRTFTAYRTLADDLSAVQHQLRFLDSLTMGGSVRQNRFYRARLSEAKPFTRGNLFHIPADLRYNVATQRFTIHGLPCLYLGGSTYVCWRELGEPDPGDLAFSGFWLDDPDSFRFLDLRHRPAWFAEWFRANVRSRAKIIWSIS